MATKWLVGKSTKQSIGPAFKTKKAALQYGRDNVEGIFFVWKATVHLWPLNGTFSEKGDIVSALNTGESHA